MIDNGLSRLVFGWLGSFLMVNAAFVNYRLAKYFDYMRMIDRQVNLNTATAISLSAAMAKRALTDDEFNFVSQVLAGKGPANDNVSE